eukprot:365182-Chlamydomonas_euryale.AAC.10
MQHQHKPPSERPARNFLDGGPARDFLEAGIPLRSVVVTRIKARVHLLVATSGGSRARVCAVLTKSAEVCGEAVAAALVSPKRCSAMHARRSARFARQRHGSISLARAIPVPGLDPWFGSPTHAARAAPRCGVDARGPAVGRNQPARQARQRGGGGRGGRAGRASELAVARDDAVVLAADAGQPERLGAVRLPAGRLRPRQRAGARGQRRRCVVQRSGRRRAGRAVLLCVAASGAAAALHRRAADSPSGGRSGLSRD